ncbi:MAG: hypothetical protein ACREF6_18885 [Alphaproteobacteria bacterium]
MWAKYPSLQHALKGITATTKVAPDLITARTTLTAIHEKALAAKKKG